MQLKRILRNIGLAALPLLIILAGMQFIDGFNWSLTDYILAVVLLVILAVAAELITIGISAKKVTKSMILGAILVVAVALFYIEQAVGIFK